MPRITVKGPIISNDEAWIYDWFEIDYTSPRIVDDQLAAAAGAEVEVDINSPGGYVYEGSEIYSALKAYKGRVVINIVGVAASAASVIAMGGDVVRISPTGQIMIHNSAMLAAGDHRDMTHASGELQQTDRSIANAYRIKTGMSEAEVLELMNAETWFTAQDALEKKLVDEIMYDPQGQLKPVASGVATQMIPRAVIDKIRNETNRQKNNGDGSTPAKRPNTKPTAAPAAIKEEPKAMDEKELKEKFPDLYNKLRNDGAEQERTRITDLQDMADAPGAKEIVEEAIKNGGSAADVAMKIVAASKQRVQNVGAARTADGQKSNAGAVPPDEAPIDGKTQAQVYEEEATALGDIIKNMAGGKR